MDINPNLLNKLIQKRLILPKLSTTDKGDSKIIARQLDIALMENGFKMSKELLNYIGGLSFSDSIQSSNVLLNSVKELVGEHIKHNVYFKEFPNNIPDTLDFWWKIICQWYFIGETEYGRHQHSYEEMLECCEKFKPKKLNLKVISLGKTFLEEMNDLYVSLAASSIPLNKEDILLLSELFASGYYSDCNIVIRENKAVINSLKIQNKLNAQVDTLLDILRIACYLSGGDVSLTEKTKFISFKRPVRKLLLFLINEVVKEDHSKIEDINNRKEEFKRLAERLHPFELSIKYPFAAKVFSFVNGDKKIKITAAKIDNAFKNKKIDAAIRLLSDSPGRLFRNVDRITRNSNKSQFKLLLSEMKKGANKVSGRVLLSLYEHLDNRQSKPDYRLFINKSGSGYSSVNNLEAIASIQTKDIQKILWKELAKRIKPISSLCINNDLIDIAVPMSDKNKSSGFQILPRGSEFGLEKNKPILRFFVYWKQKSQRTDYDLSCAFYDKNFNFVNHVSWTQLTGIGGYHSGDLTDATNGATEFIDIDLNKIDQDIYYIAPTINIYAGEKFNECEESFFGFMMRDLSEKGKPFESSTVKTKFDLRGDKQVCMPLVFCRKDGGFTAKWLDLYSNGRFYCNSVEKNKFTTILLAKSILDKKYLKFNKFLELYADKSKNIIDLKDINIKKPITYIGLNRPEKLSSDSEIFTLNNLFALIPK